MSKFVGNRKYKLLHLFPKWTFFGPNPIKSDYYLLYRDSVDNELSAFFEICIYPGNKVTSCVWNPSRRLEKGIRALIIDLLSKSEAKKSRAEIITSHSYISILTLASSLPILIPEIKEPQTVILRQFVVLERVREPFSRNHNYKLLVCSEFHSIN